MLYDPKWEKPAETTNADPLTLPAVIAWLEKQPADKVGAKIIKGDHFHLTGNGAALAPVGVDPLGRLWREDGDSLTCIYDPRPKPWDHT